MSKVLRGECRRKLVFEYLSELLRLHQAGLARALSLLLPGIGSMVSWHMYARIRVKVGYKLGLGYDVLGTTPA